MKNLLIMGAGGFGREVLQWARDAGLDQGEWRIRGFVDDDPDALRRSPETLPGIVGTIDGYAIGSDDFFVCGVGTPRVKKACVERLLARGAKFVTLVHPRAVLGQSVRLGAGCVICPGAVLTADVRLGDFVMVNCCSSVGHDVRIGDWTTLSAHCDVTGCVELGRGVFMGSHAAVIPGKKVGDWAVIGAGSTGFWDVPASATIVGVPGHVIVRGDGRP